MEIKMIQTFQDSDIEEKFQKNYFENTLNQMRWSLILVACLVACFSLLDIWVVPDIKERIWIIRSGMILTTVFIFILSKASWFKNHWKWLISFDGLVLGFSISGMVFIGGENGNLLYPAGLPLVIIWYIFSGLTLIPTAISSSLIILSYSTVSIGLNTTPLYLVINHHSFLISTLLLVIVVTYINEKRHRKAFSSEIGTDIFKIIKLIDFKTIDNYKNGMIILNGFIQVLNDKYSDQNTYGSLEILDDCKVSLIISTTEDKRESIEQLLKDYALIFMKKKPSLSLYNNQKSTEISEEEIKFAIDIREKLQLNFNEIENPAFQMLQQTVEIQGENLKEQNERIRKLEEENGQLIIQKPKTQLSPREFEVLSLLQEKGSTNCSISSALGITENTVETHIRNIKRKLGINDREILKKIDLKAFSQ